MAVVSRSPAKGVKSTELNVHVAKGTGVIKVDVTGNIGLRAERLAIPTNRQVVMRMITGTTSSTGVRIIMLMIDKSVTIVMIVLARATSGAVRRHVRQVGVEVHTTVRMLVGDRGRRVIRIVGIAGCMNLVGMLALPVIGSTLRVIVMRVIGHGGVVVVGERMGVIVKLVFMSGWSVRMGHPGVLMGMGEQRMGVRRRGARPAAALIRPLGGRAGRPAQATRIRLRLRRSVLTHDRVGGDPFIGGGRSIAPRLLGVRSVGNGARASTRAAVVSRFLSWIPPVIWPDCSVDGFPGMTEQSGHLAVAMEVSVTAVV